MENQKRILLKDYKNLTDLKLRLGWGKTGQQNIIDNDYPYMGTYRISQASAYYQFGDHGLPLCARVLMIKH